MKRRRAFGVAAILGLAFTCCVVPRKTPLVDPFRLSFPLVEAGTLEIEGTVAGQPRSRDGVVYFATSEGLLTAVVVPARQFFWKFKAEHSVSVSPELGEDHILLRDDANVLYVIDFRGTLVWKKQIGETVTSAFREENGRVYFGTASGRVMALDLSVHGAPVWEFPTAAAITAGPVFAGDMIIFGAADGRLLALSRAGKLVWEFAAKGAIIADPAEADGRVYFGTENRFFYCLSAATGKKKWSRGLQGAPLHPALIHGRRLAVSASNSVLYFLSGKGGSILSWEAIPSRVVHDLAAAWPMILVSSGGPSLRALDFSTGKRLGEHTASGPLSAGALWVSPFVVLLVGDEESGCQSLVFLRGAAGSRGHRGQEPRR
ncbi:MAG TPA: PQQ-binding-like beta-propeller repeat protein [Candidatus Latescibacteria bacterium]|nr:PQQ-binding-like beta-propeller repeat protein [Candidatus Latescibacterota bacterium]